MLQNWEMFEDYTGMEYPRENIPAENDVYKEIRPKWGKLFHPGGQLLYEGNLVDDMAYGAGTSYYLNGRPCQTGLFGPNGLICGREFYYNGQVRFEGTYEYNHGFYVNIPSFGAYYDYKGNLKYYGAINFGGENEYSVRPYVLEPEGFGPVMDPLLTPHADFRFGGEKARKYYGEKPYGYCMTPEERYNRDRRLLNLPKGLHEDFMKEYSKESAEGKQQLLMDFCKHLESMFPYKWGKDPRHEKIGKPLEERGINPDNWLWHLDEMTDREITYMLDQEPCIGQQNEGRMARPEATDRQWAEAMLYFGI